MNLYLWYGGGGGCRRTFFWLEFVLMYSILFFGRRYITMHKCVFLAHRHFFSSGAGLFSCFRLRGTQRACRNTTAQVWALPDVRGTCSGGSKSQVPTGRNSEHVGPYRLLQTHVRVKRMYDGSCDIWNLECHHCRQTLLNWWWQSFSPTPTCRTCDHL